MYLNSYYLTTLATSVLCLVIISFAVVRLGLCYKKTRPRIKYTALIFLALVAACQPYFSSFLPGVGLLALAVCIIILLLDGTPALRVYKDKEQVFDTQFFDPHTFFEED